MTKFIVRLFYSHNKPCDNYVEVNCTCLVDVCMIARGWLRESAAIAVNVYDSCDNYLIGYAL